MLSPENDFQTAPLDDSDVDVAGLALLQERERTKAKSSSSSASASTLDETADVSSFDGDSWRFCAQEGAECVLDAPSGTSGDGNGAVTFVRFGAGER